MTSNIQPMQLSTPSLRHCMREPTPGMVFKGYLRHASLRGVGFAAAMPSFRFQLWHEALEILEPHTTNRGKMNEFYLTANACLHKVYAVANTSLRQCLRNLRRHGSLRLGHNMSCGVPTLSIFRDLKKKTLLTCC